MKKTLNIFKDSKKKKYNSSGIEVKMAILPGMVGGYMCPTCGYRPCYLSHCMRCGQPLVYDEYQWEEYKERYANIDQECILVDQKQREMVKKGIIEPDTDLDGNLIPTLCEIRAKVLLEMQNEKK